MRGLSKQARQELKSCLTLLLKSFRANSYHATITGTQHALVGELANLCSAIIPIRQACKHSILLPPNPWHALLKGVCQAKPACKPITLLKLKLRVGPAIQPEIASV